jgi:hypothetical protein
VPISLGEDVTRLVPQRPRCHPLLILSTLMANECRGAPTNQRNGSLVRLRLGTGDDDALTGDTRQCSNHSQLMSTEVHVLPTQPKQLTPPHAETECQDGQRLKTVTLRRFKHSSRLVGSESVIELDASGSWRIGVLLCVEADEVTNLDIALKVELAMYELIVPPTSRQRVPSTSAHRTPRLPRLRSCCRVSVI